MFVTRMLWIGLYGGSVYCLLVCLRVDLGVVGLYGYFRGFVVVLLLCFCCCILVCGVCDLVFGVWGVVPAVGFIDFGWVL